MNFKNVLNVFVLCIKAFNEIDDSEEMPVEIVFQQHKEESSPNCLLCVELVKLAEKRLNKHTTKVSSEFINPVNI